LCDVEKALERLVYIQHTFLEKDWDVFQERLRIIANEGPFEPKGCPGYKIYKKRVIGRPHGG
jgi:hypothetical protein